MRKGIGSLLSRLPTFLKYSGLWIPFAVTGAAVTGTYFFLPEYVWTIKQISGVFCSSLVLSLYVWSINRIARMNGKENFPLIPLFTSTDPMYQISYRTQALNRKPPTQLLHKSPEGIVLGMSADKYVCVVPGEVGASHTLLLGASGSGKTSSVLLSTLLANLGLVSKKPQHKTPTFVLIDVKFELHEKGIPVGCPCAVVNFRDRSGWGIDFFYDLDEDSPVDEVYSTMRRVVFCLIEKKPNSTTEDFWPDAARNVLLGLFVFGWQKGFHTLPDLVDFALSDNLNSLINNILAEVDDSSIISKLLIPFGGDSADETLSSIAMNMGNALALLASDTSLRFLLRESSKKITPAMLEEGINIDLQVMDRDLEVYAPILALALDSICYHLCSAEREHFISENPLDNQVIIIVDEMGRLPAIQNLNNLLMIGRSRGVSVLAAVQSWEAVEGIYGEHVAANMLANFPYRVFLQVQPESKDVEMAVKAFGKYTEKKKSVNSGKNPSCNYSFTEQDVLEAKNLLELPFRNKVAILSSYGAFFTRKCQYFRDKKLSKIAEQIKKQKQIISNSKEENV